MFLLLACVHTSGGKTATADPAPPLWRIPVRDLSDVACGDGHCLALHQGQLSTLPAMQPVPGFSLEGWDTLHFGSGWEVEGPCETGRCAASLSLDPPSLGASRPAAALPVPAPAPTDLGDRWISAWNQGRSQQWRAGFDRLIGAPGPAIIHLLKGSEGAAQLLRQGSDLAVARIGLGGAEGADFPANLAMHPTGSEAYLCAWPSPLVIAFDPVTLQRHWTLPLEGAAQGLFVDPTGRFLVVATGSTEAEGPWDWPVPEAGGTDDPNRDEVLRALPRPPMSTVEVIDLQDHSVRVELQGRYRRWLQLPDQRVVVASDQEIIFFHP